MEKTLDNPRDSIIKFDKSEMKFQYNPIYYCIINTEVPNHQYYE
jgi:hypothetical protein